MKYLTLHVGGVLFTLLFDGRGGDDYIHPLFTCESNRNSKFVGYFLHVTYRGVLGRDVP